MNTAREMQSLLATYPQYRNLLFRRGYVITNADGLDLGGYPFAGNWACAELGELSRRRVAIYHHSDRRVQVRERGGVSIAIIGHAYNPVTMETDELRILDGLLLKWAEGEKQFFEQVSDLTGIHIIAVLVDGRLLVVQDCAGMMSCYFGQVGKELFITSHPQLVGDLRGLQRDPFVTKLVTSRQYNIGNRHLPGNSSPFFQLKRLGGNTYAEFGDSEPRIRRFFPNSPVHSVTAQPDIDRVVQECADLLHANQELASTKWARPAISLTGGTDSKTTLASTSGLYDRFTYFSFHSKPSEVADAKAAHRICSSLGLAHEVYAIPPSNEDVEDFAVLKRIIDHNTSYFVNLADHEIRKMIYLAGLDEFDVEVKSWVSEITRVFLERKYGIKMPGQLTPRHFSIFQTRYFGNPRLLAESDRRYAAYLREICLERASNGYEHADLFYWEVRMGAWGASVVSAFDVCHEVTMPFNNRRLITLLLSLPREMRKIDAAHHAIITLSEPRIGARDVEIRNQYFHNHRILLEKLYYQYRITPAGLARALRTAFRMDGGY